MKAPTSWIQDYLGKKLSTKAMAEALEAGGIEIEEIMYAAKLDEQIIVAKVKKVMQHPNADKLHLAIVDTGKGEIEVVCGAPNLETGQIVALAQVGAKLPDGTVIKTAEIRGQASNGMLCSARELGLSDDHSGILVLDESSKLGAPVSHVLSSDDVIDVTTQANRFDLLSLLGLAREISAQSDVDLKMPPVTTPVDEGRSLEVKIEATEAVKRYMLLGLSFDQSHGTAQLAKDRLEAVGLRSINLPVDITNYTLWETGQPLHAFDADMVKLPITVRFAKASEKLQTLDGVKRDLTAKDLVIADASGPIALAGVMGGKSTEVTDKTKEILLESASFDAAVVRKMAQRHGLRSDASSRFERNLPPELAEFGMQRALYSFKMAVEAKQTTKLHDTMGAKPTQTVIVIQAVQMARILSIDVTAASVVKQLSKFGFIVKPNGTSLEVEVPWWRPDVKLAEDLAEEYIRLIGYDGVPARLPKWQPAMVKADQYWPNLWNAKSTLKGLGLFEVITYSFVAKEQLEQLGYQAGDHLKLKNPMSSEQAYLRQNLLPSLLAVMVRNQHYAAELGIYETSQVFIPTKPGTQPLEPKQLGVLIKSQQPYQSVKATLDALAAAFNAKLTIESKDAGEFLPGLSAIIKAGKTPIGRIGQVHPKRAVGLKSKLGLGYLELDLEQLFSSSEPRVYQPISRYPSIYRDLAVVVDRDRLWQDLQSAIEATELAKVSFLSDYYDDSLGASKKSLALRLEMSSLTATLIDKEADKRLAQIVALLAKHFGAKPRT